MIPAVLGAMSSPVLVLHGSDAKLHMTRSARHVADHVPLSTTVLETVQNLSLDVMCEQHSARDVRTDHLCVDRGHALSGHDHPFPTGPHPPAGERCEGHPVRQSEPAAGSPPDGSIGPCRGRGEVGRAERSVDQRPSHEPDGREPRHEVEREQGADVQHRLPEPGEPEGCAP